MSRREELECLAVRKLELRIVKHGDGSADSQPAEQRYPKVAQLDHNARQDLVKRDPADVRGGARDAPQALPWLHDDAAGGHGRRGDLHGR